MKSKIAALSKNEDFKNLLKGKKISNNYITIFFGKLPNKNNSNLNISFVTKKKLGNAVKRNKIKRRLRNIVNEALKKISFNFNYSYLVIAKTTMLNNEYTKIKKVCLKILKKLNNEYYFVYINKNNKNLSNFYKSIFNSFLPLSSYLF